MNCQEISMNVLAVNNFNLYTKNCNQRISTALQHNLKLETLKRYQRKFEKFNEAKNAIFSILIVFNLNNSEFMAP